MTVMAKPTSLRRALPWQKMQDGLHDWVHACTGLPTLWTKIAPGTLQAPRAYASLSLAPEVRSIGLDGRGMINRIGSVPTPAIGQEVRAVAFGLRALDIRIDVFSDSALLADNAMSYAEDLRLSLALESVIDLLTRSGLCQRTKGDVRDLSEVQESVWVSRAQLEIGFTVAAFVSDGDGSGYVGEVIGTATIIDGPTVPVDVKGS
jgi:hypothetical protein